MDVVMGVFALTAISASFFSLGWAVRDYLLKRNGH